jgi:DNA-binding NtrC family response regulator
MKHRVLVVDDQEVMLDIVREAFCDRDLDIVGVNTAKKALDYVLENRVDIVILDIMLPGLKGTDIFFRLKDADPFIQIIVMTAYPSYETVIHMIKGGACDFLLKPFDDNDLRKIVGEALERLERWSPLRHECMDGGD